MNATHTAGPWKVTNADTVVGPAGNVVAECCGYSVKAEDAAQRAQGGREANARLIAAAPDLLAACERALPWIGKLIADGGHMSSVAPNDAVGAMDQLQAAIEKALGY